MRTFILILACLAGSVLGNSLQVIGYGKVFYEVDVADIEFSVSVRNKNVQECKREHDAIITELNKYLKKKNYPEEIIKLEDTILKRQSTQRKENPDFYLAKSVYSMRTDRIGDLSELQADIVSLGVDEINYVRLFSSKQRELEDDARKRAIEDAKKKAELTVEALGWKLKQATHIKYGKDMYQKYKVPSGFGSRGGNTGGGVRVVGSANFVDATVTLTFDYELEEDEKPSKE